MSFLMADSVRLMHCLRSPSFSPEPLEATEKDPAFVTNRGVCECASGIRSMATYLSSGRVSGHLLPSESNHGATCTFDVPDDLCVPGLSLTVLLPSLVVLGRTWFVGPWLVLVSGVSCEPRPLRTTVMGLRERGSRGGVAMER